MDTITVICPQCHHENSIPTPSRDGGHVLCTQCSHVFKVVPKIRTNKLHDIRSNQGKLTASASPDEIMSALATMLSHTNQQTARQMPPKDTSPTATNAQPSISKLLSEPAAAISESTPSASISTMTLTQTLPSAPKQAPTTESTMPVVTPARSDNGNTVNNLVFTLLPAQETTKHHQVDADVPLLLNDTIEKTEAISVNQQRLHEQQSRLHKEFNWTLASLVALTVLIIQLFYLMAVK
ncbi:hypothetical protein [Snodgrassella sp. CFCC 13594]|uniref:hypothetical protein n=1 Tax=Snodgrassella sp. CFCC 13594 TaxID=1775559 RepID=UPI00083493F6|nr:hypothetical protein [Snodgrassella sp. CFCC 13594]